MPPINLNFFTIDKESETGTGTGSGILADYKHLQAKFIIPDPTEELKQIYEVNRLADLIGIRAEKYDSPEYKHLISDDGKYLKPRVSGLSGLSGLSGSGDQSEALVPVPKMVQNPNFDQMLILIKRLRGEKTIRALKRLVLFLEDLPLPRIKAELSSDVMAFRNLYELSNRTEFDVRYCFKITDILSYFYNHYVVASS